MVGLPEDKLCEHCWHSTEKPCPRLIDCLNDGPQCHDDQECIDKFKQWKINASRLNASRPVIYIGTGTCGLGAGAARTLEATKTWLNDHAVEADVVEVGCIGLCVEEPLLEVQLPGRSRVMFRQVQENQVGEILALALNGDFTHKLILGQQGDESLEPWPAIPLLGEHPFFAPQTRWVMANCGIIDPGSIEEYIARGGYMATSRALSGLTREQLCDLVETSGLRGRGGGGFPTGRKWKFSLATPADKKYLVCNADEGDPGAFMDRAVIEGDPHRLLEGMLLAAYAFGASKAYVYIRAEYPLAIQRLVAAIAQAKKIGLLGNNILDSGFSLEIAIKEGAGAFVCGEETALLGSIEGRRGMPRPRPPYPAVEGLFNKPTVINNVETLANVPRIVLHGPEAYSALGTEGSRGTKVFALSGKISRTGLVEVAMGTSLQEIVEQIGGGVPDGRKFKAVQMGGPSGGCIPTAHLDVKIDYESLKELGAMMGSGGLVVMDEDNCMIDVARFFMDFIQRESCGKCIPCREGTRRMKEILDRIAQGRRGEKGIDSLERFQGVMYLERLSKVIKDTSLCGLGQSAPNPVLSTLRWFRHEYEEHVYERQCAAHACGELLTYSIDPDKCTGCTVCAVKCPVDAIVGAPKSLHHIIEEKCIGCGSCVDACRVEAIVVE
jgi:NADH:ubiquinone oxidoreductase subunit F (NADH-binding)